MHKLWWDILLLVHIVCLWHVVNARRRGKVQLPNYICPPMGYGPCDVRLLLEKTQNRKEFFISETNDPDSLIPCAGIKSMLQGTHFTPTTNSTVAFLCESNGNLKDAFGVIYYSGFLKEVINPLISYGMIWNVTATLVNSQRTKDLESRDYYGRVALKQGECSADVGELAVMDEVKKGEKRGTWVITFKSQNVLSLFTSNLVLCVCNFWRPCSTIRDYNELLAIPEIDGPKISAPIEVECLVGAKCTVDIPGTYRARMNNIVAYNSTNNTSKPLKNNGSTYEYIIDEGQKATRGLVSLRLYWFPYSSTMRNSNVKIELGKISVHDYSHDTLYLAPFGKQSIKIPLFQKMQPQARFFIFQREKVADKTMVLNTSSLEWQNVYVANVIDNEIVIDFRLYPTKEYILRFMPECSGPHCKDAATTENTGIVANLVPKGLRNFEEAVCTENDYCTVTLETVNIQRNEDVRKKIVLARSCRSGSVDMPAITLDGAPTETRTNLTSRTLFKWLATVQGDSIPSGETLKLCWCGVVVEGGDGCINGGFSIEAGNLHVQTNLSRPVICYPGSYCSSLLKIENVPGTEYFLADDCSKLQPFKLNDNSPYFIKTGISHHNGTSLRLHAYLSPEFDHLGEFHLCSLTQDSVTNNKVTQGLPYTIQIKSKAAFTFSDSAEIKMKPSVLFMNIWTSRKVVLDPDESIYQFLILSNECGESRTMVEIFHYRKGGIEISSTAKTFHKKVCWCKAFGEERCSKGDEFKYEVGEIFSSGFIPGNNIACDMDSYCRLTLSHNGFYDISRGLSSFLSAGVKIIIQKDCEMIESNGENTLEQYSRSSPTTIKELNEVFFLKTEIQFLGLLNAAIPGEYSLCLCSATELLFEDIGKIIVRGLHIQHRVVGVYLGKAFNIVVTGYKMDNVKGFLSSNRSCKWKLNDGPYIVRISETPALRYDVGGTSVLIWHDVLILRRANATSLEASSSQIEASAKIYMCITTPSATFFTGQSFAVHYPPMVRKLPASYVGRGNLNMTPYVVSPSLFIVNLLVVSIVNDTRMNESCENNSWAEDPSRLVVTRYVFSQGSAKDFPSLSNSPNSFICWCFGYSCTTISDFRVSISLPQQMEKPKFMTIPMATGSHKLSLVGKNLCDSDRLTIVRSNVKCGSQGSSKFTTLLANINETKKYFLNMGLDHAWVERAFNEVITTGHVTRKNSDFTWTSQLLRLRQQMDGKYFMFRLCHCPFLNKYQCTRDADYSEWIGAIIDQKEVRDNALLRITTYPSDMSEGTLSCSSAYNVPAAISFVFRTKDTMDSIINVISDFAMRQRSRFEGFLMEVCYHVLKQGPIEKRTYHQILSHVNSGYFRMQRLYVNQKIKQEIILHGVDMHEGMITDIAVIPITETCEKIKPNNVLASSTINRVLNKNMILFNALTIQREGHFRFCIKVRPTTKSMKHKTMDKNYQNVKNNFKRSIMNMIRKEYIGNSNVTRQMEEEYLPEDPIESKDDTNKDKGASLLMEKSATKDTNDVTSSFLEVPQNAVWKLGGIISSTRHQFRYVFDLMAFRNFPNNEGPLNIAGIPTPGSCTRPGYSGYMVICSLVKSMTFIISDCNNDLWVVPITGSSDIFSQITRPTRLFLLGHAMQSEEWKSCKEYDNESRIVFLGSVHVVIVKFPSDLFIPSIIATFKHGLRKPMDIVCLEGKVIISDGLTHTLMAYHYADDLHDRVTQSYSIQNHCYISALYIMGNSDKTYDLFGVDSIENKLTHFVLSGTGALTLNVAEEYDGTGPIQGIDAGPLHRPNCIDGYIENSINGLVRVLIVGENVSGRILVFKLDEGGLGVYKEIQTSDVLTNLAIQPIGRKLILSSWHLYQGQMTNYVLLRTIDSYVDLSFKYNTKENYHIGSTVELVPTTKGDQFEFFMEDPDNSNEDRALLKDLGLTLDEKTGVIKGTFIVTGKFLIKIQGGNMLKTISLSFQMVALCPPSHQFHAPSKKCEQCPVGTYRDEESEDTCIQCASKRPNSTTQVAGAQFLSDCVCDVGHYMDQDACVPCEHGSLKFEVGNEPCVGRCGPNMTTVIKSEQSDDPYECVCQPKYFNLKLAIAMWERLPAEILKLTGLTFSEDNPMEPNNIDAIKNSEDVCIPCAVGYYCPGNKMMPQSCGVGRTTHDGHRDSEKSCVCDKGYGMDPVKGCVPCSGFGYKATIGNASCLRCTHPLDSRILKRKLPSLPLLGPISILSPDEWKALVHLQALHSGSSKANILVLMKDSTVFATSERATDVQQCSYCVSGKYFDGNTKYCVPCPDGKFCPGADFSPLGCGHNGVTKSQSSESPLDCLCPRGYGNEYEGFHPITRKIQCQYCPTGYFQPQEHTDGPCIPCPMHTTTNTIGAVSIMQCIPDPGYYIEISKGKESMTGTSVILNHVAGNFEDFVATNRGKIKVQCYQAINDSISFKERLTVVRPTLNSCSQTCQKNVYCKGYSFSNTIHYFDNDYNPHKANEVLMFNGLRFIKHANGVCNLYLFELSFSTFSKYGKNPTTVENTTQICKVISEMEIAIAIKLCPIGYYCNRRTNYMQCPDNSTTLGLGATSVSSCLCLPGYESPSAQPGLCVACQLGSYKQEIGNHGCKRCPDRFRTFSAGAKYITDCACSPGYYAQLTSAASTSMIHDMVFKRMKDSRLLLSSDAEILQVRREIKKRKVAQKEAVVNGSNPYQIELKQDDGDSDGQIYSFVYLSRAVTIVPQNAPRTFLEKISDHQAITCKRCKLHHYCPGGWVKSSKSKAVHNIPRRCPEGSSVPRESTNAISVAHCLCLPGYKVKTRVRNSNKSSEDKSNTDEKPGDRSPDVDSSVGNESIGQNDTDRDKNDRAETNNEVNESYEQEDILTPQCEKCEAGMYKDGQENSSCSGRCMQYATTFGGAVSKKQCFCTYGRYMMFEAVLGSVQLTCARCMEGAFCAGGLYPEVVEKLKNDGNFVDIDLSDHVQPQARFGFFAAFKEQGVDTWHPKNQLMLPLSSVPTELLHFHACPLEYNCVSGNKSRCYPGSDGYLCMNCLYGHGRSYFRSPCYQCYNLVGEFGNYMYGRWVLWAFAALLLVLLRKKLFFQFVILKILVDLYFSMVPYGLIPLNTPSSLRRFAGYYNAFFGYQQKLFRYVRIHCILSRFNIDIFDEVHIWYAQRFLTAFQPLFDAFFMSVISAGFWAIYQTVTNLYGRHWLRRQQPVKEPMEKQATQELNTLEVKNPLRTLATQDTMDYGVSCLRKTWLSYWECLLALYYLSFQFICQELFQLVWCVDVQYKDAPAFKVLLHLPSHVCASNNRLFIYGAIGAVTILTILLSCFTVLIVVMVKRKRAHVIFTTGRQKHALAWDSLLFLRRFIVAINTIFQPSTASTGATEKLRISFSILTTSVLLILHMSLLPYQIRDDNVYNRMKVLSLILNAFTAFMILGSFSYDFNYYSMFPLAAFIFYSLLLLFYVLVECGYIADLRPKLRRRPRFCREFWSFCRHLLVWSCKAQISFNYTKGDMVIEKPFSGNKQSDTSNNKRNKRAMIALNGRRALCISIEQSVGRYMMEQRCFRMPLHWEEFVIRYAFGYKWANINMRRGTITNNEIHVRELSEAFIFDIGPINSWQLSMAIINAKIRTLVAKYKMFEQEKMGKLWTLKFQYSKLCFEATELLNGQVDNVSEMIDLVHQLDRLHRRADYLQTQMELQWRHAEDGQRATRQVQELGEGMEALIYAPLTNEEIISQIEEYELLKAKQNRFTE